MINTRNDLKRIIKIEKRLYLTSGSSLESRVCSENSCFIYAFQKWLRRTEYHHNNSGVYHKIMYVLCRRRKNILGRKLGIEIWDNTFDDGLQIYHAGNIVINGMSRVGKNCKLHGSNCIGNNGKTLDSPVIGDNVRIGVGARVIGGVVIADNVTIAAGAVVVDSFEQEGVTIGGVPARIIKEK